jgi:hypothetical protein
LWRIISTSRTCATEGAAFGIFADSGFRRPFLILVSMAALVYILFILRKLSDHQKLTTVALSLIFSGALSMIGNPEMVAFAKKSPRRLSGCLLRCNWQKLIQII